MFRNCCPCLPWMIPVDDENSLNDWECRNNEQLVPLREPIREAAKRLCEKTIDCQYGEDRLERHFTNKCHRESEPAGMSWNKRSRQNGWGNLFRGRLLEAGSSGCWEHNCCGVTRCLAGVRFQASSAPWARKPVVDSLKLAASALFARSLASAVFASMSAL